MANSSNSSVIQITEEMKVSYLEYAMSVIVSRAVPDVRDGLKPVHRRILYAMDSISAHPNKNYKKSARIVGEVIGKYHPHGDTAIYDSLVRMAQNFSVMAPLIEGQGNFGSVDNDPPASMRYTEARLSGISMKLLEDIEKCTEMKPNYDNTEKEPSVLPAAFPNLLVNGSDGIAVGMATSIPTHNLSEVIDATLSLIDNNDISDEEMIKNIQGPDLPTAGLIVNKSSIRNSMLSGRGSVVIRGKVVIERDSKGKEFIVIQEIPYQVVKAKMIEKIAELVRDKKIDSISFIRDESNKEGIRVVVGVKKNFSTEILLNQLYKYTQLQTSISYNNLVLNKGKPELMSVPRIIRLFLEFREDVITKIKKYYLNKARDRAHVVIGLHIAIDSIDKVISIIRGSQNANEAKEKLLSEKWKATDIVIKMIALVEDKKNEVKDGYFMFTENQVKSILEMRLSRLTGLESEKIQEELNELAFEIKDLLSILSNRSRILSIIKEELIAIKTKFGRERLTKMEDLYLSEDEDSLMEPEDMLVMISKKGYIKRTSLSSYRTQKRGGVGKNAVFGNNSSSSLNTDEEDFTSSMFISSTVDNILFFTNHGRVYKLKTHKIPLTSQNSKGRAIVNLLNLNEDEFVTSYVVIKKENENCNLEKYLIFSTKLGNIRKSSLSDFTYIPSNGKNAISLSDKDELISVELASDDDNIFIATKKGMSIRFSVSSLRLIKSRSSSGVIGMSLSNNDEAISMCILPNNENNLAIKEEFLKNKVNLRVLAKDPNEENIDFLKQNFKSNLFDFETFVKLSKNERFLLTINKGGFGKKTSSYEYRITNRAGKGIINADTEKGDIISVFIVDEKDEIMITCKSGKMIRCSVKNIPIISRNTKGVKLINTKNKDEVVSVAKVCTIIDQEKEKED